MPCSDNQALDYLNDHRTQRILKEQSDLEKRIKQLESTDAQKEIAKLQEAVTKLAHKLNKTTGLLCSATYTLNQNGLLKDKEMVDWYDEHTEEDVQRMKSELENIVNRKNYGVKAFIKWYNTLNEKERTLFESRSEFSGYSVEKK